MKSKRRFPPPAVASALVAVLVVAGCLGGGDPAADDAAPAGNGPQPVQFTSGGDAEVEFVEFPDEVPRPEPRELFNETFTYSFTENLGNVRFVVDEDWYFVRVFLHIERDETTPACGIIMGDPTDSDDWTLQRYLDDGKMPTTGAHVISPSGDTNWIPYHSGAFCTPDPVSGGGTALSEFHVFTGEPGDWLIRQSGRGVGVVVSMAGVGTDDLPVVQGGSTATL